MWTIIRTGNSQVRFERRVTPLERVVLGICAALPLMAPYELLYKPGWQSINPYSLFSLLLSLGAISVSGFFVMASLMGLHETIVINGKTQVVCYSTKSILQKRRQVAYPFDRIAGLTVAEHQWSDGPSSYNLAISMVQGKKIEFGDFNSREAAQAQLEELKSWFFASAQSV